MIQRIQSLWLFLAAMINGLLFLPSLSKLYRYITPTGITGGEVKYLTTTNHLPLLLITAVITILPLIAIFLFKDRKRQRGLAVMSIVATIAFFSVLLMKIGNIRAGVPRVSGDSYVIPGPILPAIALVLLIMAIRGIRKDEKLLKSLDRLR